MTVLERQMPIFQLELTKRFDVVRATAKLVTTFQIVDSWK